MTFKSSEVEVEVIASPSLESFMIEDGYGRFELEADADEFNQIMIKRLNDR
ncbi:hypothetical protein LV78_003046 [Actinosynnema pretiosum]|nr:hypothetical protein [Actinosynnema pretiosum]